MNKWSPLALQALKMATRPNGYPKYAQGLPAVMMVPRPEAYRVMKYLDAWQGNSLKMAFMPSSSPANVNMDFKWFHSKGRH